MVIRPSTAVLGLGALWLLRRRARARREEAAEAGAAAIPEGEADVDEAILIAEEPTLEPTLEPEPGTPEYVQWALEQILRHAPTIAWAANWNRSPGAIIRAAEAGELDYITT